LFYFRPPTSPDFSSGTCSCSYLERPSFFPFPDPSFSHPLVRAGLSLFFFCRCRPVPLSLFSKTPPSVAGFPRFSARRQIAVPCSFKEIPLCPLLVCCCLYFPFRHSWFFFPAMTPHLEEKTDRSLSSRPFPPHAKSPLPACPTHIHTDSPNKEPVRPDVHAPPPPRLFRIHKRVFRRLCVVVVDPLPIADQIAVRNFHFRGLKHSRFSSRSWCFPSLCPQGSRVFSELPAMPSPCGALGFAVLLGGTRSRPVASR